MSDIQDSDKKAMVFVELCKFQVEKFHKSREIEWKMNFSLWTLIVLAGGGLLGRYKPHDFLIPIIIASIITVIHFSWLWKMQWSQEVDFNYFEEYRGEVEKAATGVKLNHVDKRLVPWCPPFSRLCESRLLWTIGDAGVTAFLFVVTLLVLSATDISPNKEMRINATPSSQTLKEGASASSETPVDRTPLKREASKIKKAPVLGVPS